MKDAHYIRTLWLFFFFLIALMGVLTFDLPPVARRAPEKVVFATLLLLFIELYYSIWAHQKDHAKIPENQVTRNSDRMSEEPYLREWISIGWLPLLLVLFYFVGFLAAPPVFFYFYFRRRMRKNHYAISACYTIVWVFTHSLLTKILGSPLYQGAIAIHWSHFLPY